MAKSESSEFEKFDETMRKLMKVTHDEIKAKPLVRDTNVLPLIYDNIGITYTRLHDYGNARASYEHALALDPQRPSSRRALAELDQ